MGGTKVDYLPLLAPGRHPLSLEDIRRMAVVNFGSPPQRLRLFYSLERLVQDLLNQKIPCEIWVDGSFLTKKPDPRDVDLLVLIEADVAEQLTPEQKDLIDAIDAPAYYEGLDSFCDTTFPLGAEPEGLDDDERTWAQLFGVEHNEVWLKGIAVLRLWETDVGLRIRR